MQVSLQFCELVDLPNYLNIWIENDVYSLSMLSNLIVACAFLIVSCVVIVNQTPTTQVAQK